MDIKFYGTRGSIASPLKNAEYKNKILSILENYKKSTVTDLREFWKILPDSLKFLTGGDTTCVSITSATGNRYMIDCGTGARALGDELMKEEFGKGKGVIQLFLTHTHWDHIQGIPFFKPLYIPGNEIIFHSPYPDMEERLGLQQQPQYFPVTFSAFGSTKVFYQLKKDDTVEFSDGVSVTNHPLKHPGGSTVYKFKEKGKIFIFATDVEFTGGDMEYAKSLIDFFGNADVLVIDSQYTLDESFAKFDWGHTSYTMAVNCAHLWKVKNLFLTHHEPAYEDHKISEILNEAKEHYQNIIQNGEQGNMNIHIAREGLHIQL